MEIQASPVDGNRSRQQRGRVKRYGAKGMENQKNRGVRFYDRYVPVDLKHVTKPAEIGPASTGTTKSGSRVFKRGVRARDHRVE